MRSILRLSLVAVLVGALLGVAVAVPAAAARPKTRASACTVPSDVKRTLNKAYASDGDTDHTLDIYQPATGSGYPAVQVVHGGGWHAGTSDTMCDEAIYLARNGFVAFSINYQLTTANTPSWRSSYPDTALAARWILAHAAQYGGDPAKFASFGTSAGGNLSALLDTAGPEQGIHPVTTVTWSGPMDLTLQGYTEAGAQQKQVEADYLGCAPPNCDPEQHHQYNQDVTMSPLTHVTSDDTSLLNFNSTDEIISLASAQRMDTALANAGVAHKLVVLPGDLHAAFYECTFVSVGGVNAMVIDQTVRWLGLKLNGQVTTPTGDYTACKTH